VIGATANGWRSRYIGTISQLDKSQGR
jgi:hypothetical protein